MSDLALVLAGAAATAPVATALVDGPVRLDYARLDRPARRAAAGLTRLGLRPGDRLVMVPFTAAPPKGAAVFVCAPNCAFRRK